jgi:hypothetical protein
MNHNVMSNQKLVSFILIGMLLLLVPISSSYILQHVSGQGGTNQTQTNNLFESLVNLVKQIGAVLLFAPIAVSGNNVYITWPNNDTGHWNVFFAKSTDNGKIFGKTIILSAPNKGHTVDKDTQITVSGPNVYVTWWNNTTGVLEPLFRASHDNGTTFGKIVMMNSTRSTIPTTLKIIHPPL